MIETQLTSSPLGKKVSYIDQYDNTLLFPIERTEKRSEIGIHGKLPFYGFDTWNAFELSWLNKNGKPVVSLAKFDIPVDSKNLIESKSFKLYLNSFNNTVFESHDEVKKVLKEDLDKATESNIQIQLIDVDDLSKIILNNFEGINIDDQDIKIDKYIVDVSYLSSDKNTVVTESLYSNLLKSNCLVTGQPDWGSVFISYTGPKIDHEGLLRYLISFRNHNEFHEQCVERIYIDLMRQCGLEKLTVHARYTRRGGLDINPIRSSEKINPALNIRNSRQ